MFDNEVQNLPSDALFGEAAAPTPTTNGDHPAPESSPRHVQAGRKGAQRYHQLIQLGRLYEQEHGLKRGRQRLRQLIEEGKLYEREHGLNGDRVAARARRRPRLSTEQLLAQLLQTIARLARPSVRNQVVNLLQSLEGKPAESSR